MISPDRLERYKDFVDPERTGAPYDPRQGLERLLGVLSPDPKGIVLAAMGQDWYGTNSQLQSGTLDWLNELGISPSNWPIGLTATWQYCERRDTNKEIVDGSLVQLGAVVKKAEDPLQTLYSRSVVGAELAVPLVQQAVKFVSKARQYSESQALKGKTPHQFDSMWRILGASNSRTDQRRPIGIFDTVTFLISNKGKHRLLDIANQTHISTARLTIILPFLARCGVIDYQSAVTEKDGHKRRGWSAYTLDDQGTMFELDINNLYQVVKRRIKYFSGPTAFAKIVNHIKQHPNNAFEYRSLADRLTITPKTTSLILSVLKDLKLLKRLDPNFRIGEEISPASANDLTYLFNDWVCIPANEIANTLTPLPQKSWDRREVAVYLANYDEERSNIGPQGGEEVRRLIIAILTENGDVMKRSHITDLFNNQSERELKDGSFSRQLKHLLKSGEIEQPKPGYYRLAQK